jgi:hypothetical protein
LRIVGILYFQWPLYYSVPHELPIQQYEPLPPDIECPDPV